MHNSLLGLKVSANGRYLATTDGKPFFWLGDTAWELFHRLDREEADHYLRVRAEQGFNVVQAALIGELGGLTVPNPYGRLPLTQDDQGRYNPAAPDTSDGYSYWDHVDHIIERAETLGIYMAIVPTWGDKFRQAWGEGPEIFDGSNSYAYGRWLGERYQDRSNIVWVVGGDRILETQRHFDVVMRMAAGLREGDGGKHLITLHPQGGMSSSYHVHDEEWLDFNMIQSGHGPERDNYRLVEADYNRVPVKPTLDAEPCYEDHGLDYTKGGYFDEADVRRAAYYAVFAGAFGHTYGHHAVWPLYNGSMGDEYGKPFFRDLAESGEYFVTTWKQALHKPGGRQMGHVRALMESRSMTDRVPDQTLVIHNREGSNHARAARGRHHAMVYMPNGVRTIVQMGRIEGAEVSASWFDPRTGESIPIGRYANEGEEAFQPPTGGRGQDWVLVLDSLPLRGGQGE